MTLKFQKMRTLSVLCIQLFSFWLAVGYASCLFINSIPVSASDLSNTLTFSLPHGQLFLYAEVTTAASLALAMFIVRVHQKTSKLKLIRLYRQRNNQNNRSVCRY